MSNKNNIKNTAIVGLIGLGTGLAIGYLTAPKSGKETRQDIANNSLKFKEEQFKRYNDVQASLSEAIATGVKQLKNFKGSSQQMLDELIGQAKDAEYKALDIYRAVKSGEATDKDLDKAITHANKSKENLFKYLSK